MVKNERDKKKGQIGAHKAFARKNMQGLSSEKKCCYTFFN